MFALQSKHLHQSQVFAFITSTPTLSVTGLWCQCRLRCTRKQNRMSPWGRSVSLSLRECQQRKPPLNFDGIHPYISTHCDIPCQNTALYIPATDCITQPRLLIRSMRLNRGATSIPIHASVFLSNTPAASESTWLLTTGAKQILRLRLWPADWKET